MLKHGYIKKHNKIVRFIHLTVFNKKIKEQVSEQ